MTENVHHFDIVVVGGGMAGLIAGVRGAELGKSVVVLEQGVGDRYPCNARYSGGIFHIAYNDVKVPEPRLVEAALEITDHAADPSLINVLARNGKILVDWMTQQGVRFIRGPAEWQNWMLAPPRPIKAGMEWIGRGPDVALRRLGERLGQLDGKLQLGTRATSLIMKDRRCVGVEAECEGKPVSFHAGAVILADGGFQANHELVAKYICARPDRLKMRGAPTGIGTALQWGKRSVPVSHGWTSSTATC
ncbi:MAG: FAD-dependent oxidoreductase [Pseudolabrys sp.]